ncbi:amino acid adenylation domain-containing protein [Nocardia sp. NPDC020380]|uniref:amino acid adenylation domain-containing protein n=1 Tax=Nocardia sp. NPDC020380 TaxID=3364309 RepID=UPI0037B09E09
MTPDSTAPTPPNSLPGHPSAGRHPGPTGLSVAESSDRAANGWSAAGAEPSDSVAIGLSAPVNGSSDSAVNNGVGTVAEFEDYMGAGSTALAESDDSLLSDCAGPVEVPADVLQRLRELAERAEADEFVALSIGATVLAERMSQFGARHRVRVIQGAREAITPAPVDPGDSFSAALLGAGELRVAAVNAQDAAERVAATIVVSADGARVYAESMTAAADAPVALCWAESFVRLLSGLARDPECAMDTHPLLDAAERQRVLHGLNRHERPDIRYRTMAGPFEEQVERTPDAVALVDESGTELSYRELNSRANRLAHLLARRGVRPGMRVGICLQRSIEQIIAIYAVVKTGAGYVPMDTELPDARVAFMLEDAAPAQVLIDAVGRDRIPQGPWAIVDVTDETACADCPATDLEVTAASGGLLHILYTSGTTGRPKGVAYPTAGGLANLLWLQERYPFSPEDSALFKTSPGFDVSIWEIFWPLYHGARLVICREGGHRDPGHLARLVERFSISTLFLSPTVMGPFIEHVAAVQVPRLRWALCGGEPVTTRIRDTFHRVLPEATLINCYGPTEAGSVVDMPLPVEPGAPVPLGRPAANFRFSILDDRLEPVPAGMAGEAYIGGEIGLALGYWNSPARTSERFIADPYGPPGARLYRTGDLCRFRPDGVLEHLGRIDRQIKIRGLRVEPGEIESVLAAHPQVGDCAVLAHGTPVRLLAFVAPATGLEPTALDPAALRADTATTLAEHMRPERIMVLPRIPSTVNGKIDTAALVAAWRESVESARQAEPPASAEEAALIAIYQRVLAVETVSAGDTFIELGGNSMLAFRLLEECKVELNVRLEPARVLTGTVREVAASIRLQQ